MLFYTETLSPANKLHIVMKKTTLYNLHEQKGARIVDFAGWLMPLQYEGIVKEHLWCRQNCSVFDTSHMSKFTIKGSDAAAELSSILTADVSRIKPGRCRYCFILNEKGGIIDDAILYSISATEYMLVANAGTKNKDFRWLAPRIKKSVLVDADTYLDKIDIQGPLSDKVLQSVFNIDVSKLSFYSFDTYNVLGIDCIVSHSGYTGGKGYELYMQKEKTVEAWNILLQDERVRPAGLGARDTLRLEAGLPLYGQDMDEDTTPFEAGLRRFVDLSHRFTGRDALKEKNPEKKKVFLLALSRRAPRHGYKVFINGEGAGYVTSGSFSPSLQKGIGIAYLQTDRRIPENGIIQAGTEQGPKVDCSVITKNQLTSIVRGIYMRLPRTKRSQ
jgi:aminomethyltransferase